MSKNVHLNSIEALKELDRKRRRDDIMQVFRRSTLTRLLPRKILWDIFGPEEKDMNLVRPRLTELKDDGLLKESGKGIDPYTGRPCYLLELTQKGKDFAYPSGRGQHPPVASAPPPPKQLALAGVPETLPTN